jgi:hypothetical protein
MSTELERLFSPDVLAALRDYVDARVEERLRDATAAGDEWLTVKQAAALTGLGEWHVRTKIVDRLRAESPDDLYQPNGPGTQPLRLRRAALRNLPAS